MLWVSHAPIPPNIAAAVLGRFRLKPVNPAEPITAQAQSCKAAVIYPVGMDLSRIAAILDDLDRTSLVALLLLPGRGVELGPLAGRNGQFVLGYADSAPETIAVQLSCLLQLQRPLETLHRELSHVRTFGRDLGKAFGEIDEEMRLAARLQRDFLPKTLASLGPLRFAALFRPATWVSGDIYDVIRLDEHNAGFYLADAVGHGLPAALLTMFIKQALPTKRIVGQEYTIIPPHEAIATLNTALYEQHLSSCQFCTAAYCVANAQTLELTYARGGHPQPILFRGDQVLELDSEGPLLGILSDQAFGLGRIGLQKGDRVVLNSDGAEAAFAEDNANGRQNLITTLQSFRTLPCEVMMAEMGTRLDARQGSLHPEDDVTLVAMDVAE